mmetsp:Transcript_28403/g.74622  ORF Transcript_28403/g.74622 Transcript_28403/m.74622 type:complete len:214 (+) Transcript_28403:347-988(+)
MVAVDGVRMAPSIVLSLRCTASQHSVLLGRVDVRPRDELNVRVDVVERPQLDRVEFHLEARADLGERDILPCSGVRVVSKADVVAVVHKGHDPLRVLFWDREEVLENALGALAKLSREVVKDEVGVRFRHRARPRDIVPHHHVGEVEHGGGPKRQVAHHDAVGLAAVLVHHHNIGDIVGNAHFDELAQNVLPAVQPLGVWEEQLDLFGEHLET